MHKAYYSNLPASLQCYFKKVATIVSMKLDNLLLRNFLLDITEQEKNPFVILYGCLIVDKINDEGKKLVDFLKFKKWLKVN